MRFLHPETDHVLVPDTAVGFCGRNHIQGFQNVGLSLRVLPVENVGSLRKIHVQGGDIPEIR